jgi:hypothetical protein
MSSNTSAESRAYLKNFILIPASEQHHKRILKRVMIDRNAKPRMTAFIHEVVSVSYYHIFTRQKRLRRKFSTKKLKIAHF